MPVTSWESADIGVLHNHELSGQLLVQAVGECKVAQFCKPFPGESKSVKNKGETINIMHLNEASDPTSFGLTEDTRVPIDRLTLGTRAVTLTEFGRGVEYTNLNEQLSAFKPSSFVQKALTRQMTRALDNGAASAFKTTDVKICYIPTTLTGGTFDTDGTPSTVATANLTFDHMGVLSDYLEGDIHTPPYDGDDFIMLSCRKTLRGIKQDPLWQQIHMYLGKGDLFFKGEVGKAENIRCIGVNREGAFANTAGTSTVLGEAVIFGDEGVGYAEAQTPSLRAYEDYQFDFGRAKAAAWVGIYVFSSVWATSSDGEAKIIRITSA